MSDPVPTSADQFVEQQLDQRLAAVEQQFQADVFCLVGTLLGGTDDFVRLMIEDLRQRRAEDLRERLVVLLTTDGGYIEVAHRIVDTLRHHYGFVAFVIPSYAFRRAQFWRCQGMRFGWITIRGSVQLIPRSRIGQVG